MERIKSFTIEQYKFENVGELITFLKDKKNNAYYNNGRMIESEMVLLNKKDIPSYYYHPHGQYNFVTNRNIKFVVGEKHIE